MIDVKNFAIIHLTYYAIKVFKNQNPFENALMT